MLWTAALGLAHAGRAYVGADYVPLGRQDLVWVSEGQSTGTLVGAQDGLLVPALTAWGGVVGAQDAWLFGLAAARVSTASYADKDRTIEQSGALRPSLDYRHYLQPREAGQAVGFLQAGGYGVLPSARLFSTAYTKEEQKDADEVARDRRAQIGGLGVRVGGGAEVGWQSGLTLGARYLFVVHQGRNDTDEAYTVSTLVYGEAALVLGFEL